jgi:hypothetical protein
MSGRTTPIDWPATPFGLLDSGDALPSEPFSPRQIVPYSPLIPPDSPQGSSVVAPPPLSGSYLPTPGGGRPGSPLPVTQVERPPGTGYVPVNAPPIFPLRWPPPPGDFPIVEHADWIPGLTPQQIFLASLLVASSDAANPIGPRGLELLVDNFRYQFPRAQNAYPHSKSVMAAALRLAENHPASFGTALAAGQGQGPALRRLFWAIPRT